MKLVVLCLLLAVGALAQDEPLTRGIGKEWGPWVWPTRGEIWPKPRSTVNYNIDGYMAVRTNIFRFNVLSNTCDILDDALLRYYRYLVLEREAAWSDRAYERMKSNKIPTGFDSINSKATFRGNLDVLDVELTSPCENLPYQGMDESYELKIDTPDLPMAGRLISQSIWGILRGLESFVQLAAPSQDGSALHMNSSHITDFPRFQYRGLMIDSVRHFLPLPTMYKLIDGMEASKLNVMHWHLVDDQAFPYQSNVFPELSEQGAYNPFSHVYTQNDVRSVIEYCRLRGIRVIPEFDSPGHTRSWGNSHPELLATCYGPDGQPDGSLGPMDPSKESTFEFVNTLFGEVAGLFPDGYFHLGGDEVNYTCWSTNQAINDYMASIGIAGNYQRLEGVYVDRAIEIVRNLNMKPMVWQEVFDNGGSSIDAQTVVHVWKVQDFMQELATVTGAGHVALLSSCWYLDHLVTGGNWKELNNCEPHDFSGTTAQKDLVLGGEACMWSEYVDTNSIESRVYPRASAMAERLWSDVTQTNTVEAARRLEEFRCRLVRRGIRAQPANGPGYCPGEVFNA
ncbi:beta-hexosaminidase subunit beta-like [Cloeon dipterum]|uniref:beta-hexosaminidase subunit beta-like n=1 Tax=Cloeon dipterum TaxID=197152 RepID=UPI0032204DE7